MTASCRGDLRERVGDLRVALGTDQLRELCAVAQGDPTAIHPTFALAFELFADGGCGAGWPFLAQFSAKTARFEAGR